MSQSHAPPEANDSVRALLDQSMREYRAAYGFPFGAGKAMGADGSAGHAPAMSDEQREQVLAILKDMLRGVLALHATPDKLWDVLREKKDYVRIDPYCDGC
jgi:hypothetical protein